MNKQEHKPKRIKKPWPTKDAMEQVYAMNLWGGENAEFYSGDGSHKPEMVDPYVDAVSSFLRSFDDLLTVCDLGCGDFNVGKELVKHTSKYVAADIVPDLITRNKKKYQAGHLEFHCLDIANDDLPDGDCALVRQVLQHLSNAEIQQIVKKLADFEYVILTEHIPEEDFTPNVDIISGQGNRLKKQSGVNITAPPFNFKAEKEKQLLSVTLSDLEGVIVTTMYRRLG
jgi:hypothetical protein